MQVQFLTITIHCFSDINLHTLVYLVPTAHNPTGVTMSTSRKEEIYKVCQDEQLLLIEDDAYYYLFHGSKTSLLDLVNTKKAKDCVEEVVDKLPGLKDLPTSLLSMDVDGRVIRFDLAVEVYQSGVSSRMDILL